MNNSAQETMPTWRLWLRVSWYNWVKRHWQHYQFRRHHLHEWTSEGRDPKAFPKPGPITVNDVRAFLAHVRTVRAAIGGGE